MPPPKQKYFFNKIKPIETVTFQMKTSLWIVFINLVNENLELARNEKYLEIRQRRIISVVVFAAACIESFINEYAQEHLSNEWESIDRLSLSDKWLVVIKLLNKKELSRKAELFKDIVWLKNFRNYLIHYKARFESLKKDQSITNINQRLIIENAEKTFNIIKKSIKTFFELTELDPPDAVYGWKIIEDKSK